MTKVWRPLRRLVLAGAGEEATALLLAVVAEQRAEHKVLLGRERVERATATNAGRPKKTFTFVSFSS